MREQIALIGAPSSAGACSPGREKAPQALRNAGLVGRLNGSGHACDDLGDLRWQPDRDTPVAQNLEAVVKTVRAVEEAVASAAADRFTLVLGDDCTVGIGTVAGRLSAGDRVELIYFDLHADLNVPTSTGDGALNWMGGRPHARRPGAALKLAEIGPRRPIAGDDQIAYLGFDPAQRRRVGARADRGAGAAGDRRRRGRGRPSGSAARARAALEASCNRLAVHFDVDVIDFLDAPPWENVERYGGLRFDQAILALTALLDSDYPTALTVTEVNSDHGDPEGESLGAVGPLADALAER